MLLRKFLRKKCYRTITLLISQEDFITETEKKLLQAKHRLEEAEMRDRQKERKQRTRRLIQEGAVLEKIFPQAALMSLDELENFLCNHIQRN